MRYFVYVCDISGGLYVTSDAHELDGPDQTTDQRKKKSVPLFLRARSGPSIANQTTRADVATTLYIPIRGPCTALHPHMLWHVWYWLYLLNARLVLWALSAGRRTMQSYQWLVDE